MNIDDIVAQKVEAARRRIATERARRERQRRARAAALAQRHAAKLRHLAETTSNTTPAASGTRPNPCRPNGREITT